MLQLFIEYGLRHSFSLNMDYDTKRQATTLMFDGYTSWQHVNQLFMYFLSMFKIKVARERMLVNVIS